MKKFLVCTSLLLTGCPMAMDATIGWGSNQTIKKNLDINQKQTTAQTESQTDIAEAIIKIIPFLTPEPTPTPIPPIPKIKSITIDLEPKPLPEIPVYTRQPYTPLPPKPKLPAATSVQPPFCICK